MMILSFLVFASALAASLAIIYATVAPQWQRIVRLVSGEMETGFAPVARSAVGERQIAVRRWAAMMPVSAPSARLREVA